MAAMTSSNSNFQNPRKTYKVYILEIIRAKFHQNRFSRLGCSADTHRQTHTRTHAHTHIHTHTHTHTHFLTDTVGGEEDFDDADEYSEAETNYVEYEETIEDDQNPEGDSDWTLLDVIRNTYALERKASS